jgi:hypothetical protein
MTREEKQAFAEAAYQKAYGYELNYGSCREFGGLRCGDLQQRFAGRTFDMWKADEYAEFDKGRGDRCARATATVARWVVEML